MVDSRANALIMWIVASGISFISVWALIIAILRNSKLRSNSFDLYLVFCLAADAIFFTLMLPVNVVFLVDYYRLKYEEEYEEWVPEVVYQLGWWSEYYWTCASLWMSFAIFVQIYKLLQSNKKAKRYQPPTRRQVIRDSTIIHAFSVIVATTITLLGWFWGRIYDNYIAYLWTIYIPGVFIPALLITGMCFKVWRHQLMPPKNNRFRSLIMFFARLLASIILMVIGVIVKNTLYTRVNINSEDDGSGLRSFYVIANFFGFFQVCLALTKNELRSAFLDLWCCRCRRNSNKGALPRTRTGISTNLTAHPTEDESHRIDDKEKSQGHDDSNDLEHGNVVSHSCVDGDTSSVKNENGGSEEASEVVDTKS